MRRYKNDIHFGIYGDIYRMGALGIRGKRTLSRGLYIYIFLYFIEIYRDKFHYFCFITRFIFATQINVKGARGGESRLVLFSLVKRP